MTKVIQKLIKDTQLVKEEANNASHKIHYSQAGMRLNSRPSDTSKKHQETVIAPQGESC